MRLAPAAANVESILAKVIGEVTEELSGPAPPGYLDRETQKRLDTASA